MAKSTAPSKCCMDVEKALLATNLVATLGFAAPAVLAPRKWHKLCFVEGHPRNDEMTQFCAVAMAAVGAMGQIMANTSDKKAKKDTLKALGAAWSTSTALQANSLRRGIQRKEMGIAVTTVQGAMAATFLWAGFRKG
ncbi:hypothetical protein HYH03_004761 [Edaphochlamys debaryana]|uniref:Uncharacterized protein n=1 Tax=Edaphochlamys debaryana TaxID=47281 RepID=A0A836C2U3_9CHLO|nr:hypothetical protein HYH03_004761 [Edaphochlamys debaryana]|eukprot:KAG2497172.1 hypothetical protein HYH03_004761 [Edaphochlamys debaryana]